MHARTLSRAIIATIVGLPVASWAQDHSGHQTHGDAATSFPEVCRTQTGAPHMGHSSSDMPAMNDHQTEAMAGMMAMDRDMMQGMMKDDADVAFVCGMIAHHQGAIDMARVELKYGDNEWAKRLAQNIIDAQTREIADMTEWLKENAE